MEFRVLGKMDSSCIHLMLELVKAAGGGKFSAFLQVPAVIVAHSTVVLLLYTHSHVELDL